MKTNTSKISKMPSSFINPVPENNDIISTFDFGEINKKDPSLAAGFKLLFDKEIPFKIVNEEKKSNNEVESYESLRCKIFYRFDESAEPLVRIEVSCESDLFFHYTSEVNEEIFKVIKESQKLQTDFSEYNALVKKMFFNCINEPHIYFCVFVIQKDGIGRIDFIQNTEYKQIELLSVEFILSPPSILRKQITYRYNALRTKIEVMQNRIQVINKIMKEQNPLLLLQIQKTPASLKMTEIDKKNGKPKGK